MQCTGVVVAGCANSRGKRCEDIRTSLRRSFSYTYVFRRRPSVQYTCPRPYVIYRIRLCNDLRLWWTIKYLYIINHYQRRREIGFGLDHLTVNCKDLRDQVRARVLELARPRPRLYFYIARLRQKFYAVPRPRLNFKILVVLLSNKMKVIEFLKITEFLLWNWFLGTGTL